MYFFLYIQIKRRKSREEHGSHQNSEEHPDTDTHLNTDLKDLNIKAASNEDVEFSAKEDEGVKKNSLVKIIES